jgi:hypothetical protein
MRTCSKCKREIEDYWDYCPSCGTEIFRPTRAFIYDQLFELMKLQDNRRHYLDSKAHTYIGLLSIAVTIIVALGGLTIENIIAPRLGISYNVLILSGLYVSTVLLFIIGVIFAFQAYHIGSPIIKIDGEGKIQIPAEKLEKVYLRLYEKRFVERSDEGLVSLQNNLIHSLKIIISKNEIFNIRKSNKIIWAYHVTITAIISLLLLCVTIILSIYGIRII